MCLCLYIANRIEEATFDITKLGQNDLVLRLPWLERTDPTIDWREKTVLRAEATKTTYATNIWKPGEEAKETALGRVPKTYCKFIHLFERVSERLLPHRLLLPIYAFPSLPPALQERYHTYILMNWTKYKEMERVFVCVISNDIDNPHIIKAAHAVLNFIYLMHLPAYIRKNEFFRSAHTDLHRPWRTL